MAIVWSDRGQGVRPPVVFYNRANEAAQLLKPGSFDWEGIFGGGKASPRVRWFHSGGIFSALSPSTSELVIEAMQAAKKAGAVVSFDLNYRAKLWAVAYAAAGTEKGLSAAQAEEGAAKTLRRIASYVDVLVGNEEDLQKGLGLKGPDVEAGATQGGGKSAAGKLDPSAFLGMMENVAKDFPNIKAVATTLREVHSANRHSWSAVLWFDGRTYRAPDCELDVYDRVGGGDGFAAGLFYGLLSGKSPEEALRLGWAHGALITTTPGDTSMVSLEQVQAFAGGGSARIQR
jgi:2-dehydro-3-deoxygluconokinase